MKNGKWLWVLLVFGMLSGVFADGQPVDKEKFDEAAWKKQVEELKAALPDCFVSDGAGDPTTSGYWRFKDKAHNYTERYALLREQMLYDVRDWRDRPQKTPPPPAGRYNTVDK